MLEPGVWEHGSFNYLSKIGRATLGFKYVARILLSVFVYLDMSLKMTSIVRLVLSTTFLLLLSSLRHVPVVYSCCCNLERGHLLPQEV